MRTCTAKYPLMLKIVTVSVIFLLGCASFGPTKPNISIIDKSYAPAKKNKTNPAFLRAKALLSEISKNNSLLATELGKLPELQDEVSADEVSALEKIIDLYNSDPAVFENAFGKMSQVGKPDTRKYNSPLQALFWLSEDNKFSKENNTLIGYSIKKLLQKAWLPTFKKYSLTLSEKEAKRS